MLGKCRVLDLTDENGFLCGKILADLGAEVIKIESPRGDCARNKGPFWHDIPDPEKSLNWFAFNNNKKGITLNIDTVDGREIFKTLIKTADFVLESQHSGYLNSIGLGYSSLCKVNPKIIMVSITPFGQSGPYKDYLASDITVMAMSGLQYQTGESDGSPVNISLPQACLHAGADAAVGALIAYYHREATGKGQQVDISMQQSTAYFSANAIPFWELSQKILRRSGHFRSGMSSSTSQRQVWQCKDGLIFFILIPGRSGGKSFKALLEWMASDGLSTKDVEKIDCENMDMANISPETVDLMTTSIQRFFSGHTRKELLEGAVARSISLCPLSSMSDLLNDIQLKSRNFWVEIEHQELGSTITYPREFVKSSEGSYRTRTRAPLIGEHNKEIYEEIGISSTQLIMLKETGVI